MATEIVIRAENGQLTATAYKDGEAIGQTPTLDARGLLRALPGLLFILAIADTTEREPRPTRAKRG